MPIKLCKSCDRAPNKTVWSKCKSCEGWLCDKSNCGLICSTCDNRCCTECIKKVISKSGFHCLTCIDLKKWKIDTNYVSCVD